VRFDVMRHRYERHNPFKLVSLAGTPGICVSGAGSAFHITYFVWSKMKSRITLRERVAATLDRRLVTALAGFHGRFTVRHGRVGRIIQEFTIPNMITNEGKNHILDVQFHGTTPIGSWYLGLIDGGGFTAVAATDIYDNIDQAGNAWDEFTDYTDRNNSDNAATRPVWPENVASGQAIANVTLAIYDFTGAGTVQGLFVAGGTNAATKGDHTAGTAHKLWAATEFTSPISVVGGDDLSVIYSVGW